MDNSIDKEKEFFDRLTEFEKESGIPKIDVRIYRLPDLGIVLPPGTSSELANKIHEIYNDVFSK